MIGADFHVRAKPVEELDAFTAQINRIAHDVGKSALSAIESDLLAELQHVPGDVKLPIEWTSEKQRKAFFATDGFGHGIPYQRSGGLRDSWEISGRASGSSYVATAINRKDYAKFVVGDVNFRSRDEALKPMQKFHANTGWQPAIDTISFWFEAMRDEYDTEFDKAIGRHLATYKVERRRRR